MGTSVVVTPGNKTVNVQVNNTSNSSFSSSRSVGVFPGQASGGTDKHFAYSQIAASASWSITHNLNKYPSVVVVDSGGNIVIGDVTYINENRIVINFTATFSGKAYLN